MGNENKVRFGLKNVHYAVLTEGTTNSWGSMVAVPGAVNLDLEASGDVTNFYADNVTFYRSVANNGYEGSIEFARIPDQMRTDIFGETLDGTTKVLFEKSNAEPVPVALLFQIDGDQENELYCMYRCLMTRPNIGSETIGESKDPGTATQTLNISCLPLVTGAAAQQGLVKAKTTAETTTTARSAWFTTVPLPSTS